jgi:hypothetical protein
LDHVCKIKIPTNKEVKAEKDEKKILPTPLGFEPTTFDVDYSPGHHHAAAKVQSYQIVLTYSHIILAKKALGKCLNISLG